MKVGCVQLRARNLDVYREAAQDVFEALKTHGPSHDLLVFPECSYPGYFLVPEALREEAISGTSKFIDGVCRLAQDTDTYVAIGIAERDADGKLYNRIVLIDRHGEVLARASKQHLWHFDSNWFEEGSGTVVVDTEYGPIGLVVCADARLTEIIRQASVAGARLIVDCANLTAQGRILNEVTNPQVDYVLGVRAFENGVWVAMADKWGVEGDFATYAGQSSIYCPHGVAMASGPAVGDVIVDYDIPLVDGEIDEKFRADALERRWALDTSGLTRARPPVIAKIEDPVRIGSVLPFVSVIAAVGEVDPASCADLRQRLGRTDSDLICWPPLTKARFDAIGDDREPKEHVTSVAAVRSSRSLDLYIQHGAASWELLSHRSPVVQLYWGSLGIIRDDDIDIPEVARQFMLDGVDVIYWPHIASRSIELDLARTRAMENRVFLCTSAYSQEGRDVAASYIIDPSGVILARTLLGPSLHATQSLLPCALARIKDVVPGTNVLLGRRPTRYTTL